MKIISIKKNVCALFLTMMVAATGYAGGDYIDECRRELSVFKSNRDVFYSALIGSNLNRMAEILDKYPEIINSLLNSDFTRDGCERYPLHVAVARVGDINVITFMLNRGANVNQLGQHKLSSLHLAPTRPDIAALLLDRGAHINHRDEAGWTPLHYVAGRGHIACARLYLERGANLMLKNAYGDIPLDLARTTEMRTLFKKEELWRRRIDVVWMTSNFASPNLLRAIPEDVSRWIISMYL